MAFNSFSKDFDSQTELNTFPETWKYQLPDDFVFLETDWGSLFFKHIGKMGRAVAKQICSSYGNSVGLPVPRFPEENVFYLKYFGHDELWLGISNSD